MIIRKHWKSGHLLIFRHLFSIPFLWILYSRAILGGFMRNQNMKKQNNVVTLPMTARPALPSAALHESSICLSPYDWYFLPPGARVLKKSEEESSPVAFHQVAFGR